MKTILVALDNSPRAQAVLDAGIASALAYDAKLILFRAVGIPPEMPAAIWKTDAPSLMVILRDAAQKELEAYATKVPAKLRSEHLVTVEIGTPWQGICSAIEKEKADLVVIGSHGYGLLERMVGTTASKVVNNATCSVLVVRSADPDPQRT